MLTRQLLAAAIGMALAVLGATAEEFVLKDGTKIVGKMVRIKGDSIEIKTLYGKIKVSRGDIVTINFPENQPEPVSGQVSQMTPRVVEHSLQGTNYINRTGNFRLTIPSGWKVSDELRTEDVVAAFTSSGDTLFFVVTQETFEGSLKGYKGVAELLWKQLGSYEELSESKVTIDGRQGLLITFRAISPEPENVPVKFLVTIVPHEGGMTRMAGWCVEPLFEDALSTFEKIMLSYETITE